jgi:hypothetical protein
MSQVAHIYEGGRGWGNKDRRNVGRRAGCHSERLLIRAPGFVRDNKATTGVNGDDKENGKTTAHHRTCCTSSFFGQIESMTVSSFSAPSRGRAREGICSSSLARTALCDEDFNFAEAATSSFGLNLLMEGQQAQSRPR